MKREELVEKYAHEVVSQMDTMDLVRFAYETIINSLDNNHISEWDVLDEIYNVQCASDEELFRDFCDGLVSPQEIEDFLK